jgi:hypothetical protein
VPGAPAVLLVHAHGDAVAGRDQRRRHRDVLVDQLGLAGRVVDAGPEQVAAFALHGAGDPGLAVGRLRPDEAAVPGRALGHVRLAVVLHPHRHLLARFERLRQLDRQLAVRIAPAGGGQRLAVDLDGVDRQVAVQVELDAAQRRAGAEGERDVADDAAVAGSMRSLRSALSKSSACWARLRLAPEPRL